MLYWIDLLGVFVFAISGALAIDRRGMDLFGFIVRSSALIWGWSLPRRGEGADQ